MRLFLPQAQLEEWALEEKADIKGGHLVVSGEAGEYPVTPATRFVHLVSGEDTHKLLERVKTHAHLESLGAEVLADSVVLGDTAYEGVDGYLVELPSQSASTAPSPPKPQSETDLLAAFFLNKI